ncbi:Enoyl-(Acyl carrier protein) reductase [Ceratobasidium sp. AG-Ba]|nr:Enoyl-(Acyl carrier protein) reductase [Ceratobasidium sp. AG-Ba]QRW11637.1 Enoyl-(Acyl carrier protein) reductase [Ceratobasidium sp. AG-Ba]
MSRVAIVTGAAQGIGRAIALKLAIDGVDVAVNDIPQKQNALLELVKEIEARGRKSIAIPGNVANQVEVKEMVSKTVELLGSLDIMVANAGIAERVSILDVTDESFDRVMNINCKGVLYCYRAAAEQMIKQGRGGRILGASSMWGLHGSESYVSYCTSKFAVRAITQTAALEWGEHKITVNAYAPGWVDTPMAAVPGLQYLGPDYKEKLTSGAALKRIGEPEEIASTVSFLASEGASYITGQTFSINGGLNLS